MDLRVGLRTQVSGVRWRVQQIAPSAPHLEVALDGTVLFKTVGTADVFDATVSAGRITVTRTTGATKSLVGRGSRLAIRWSGTRTSNTTGKIPGVVQLTSPGASLTSSSPRYRYGWLDVAPSSATASTLNVVNPVRLHDEYLYGIGEVPSSWPAAALQAQVVAARSFAYTKYHAGLRSVCGCHVYGDTRDQNFTGFGKLAEGSWGAVWKAAVDATAVDATHGQAVTYRGAVITAYYGDSTGGRTQNIEDAWGGTAIAWARSVDDHWSANPAYGGSYASWTPRTRTQAAVASAFGLPNVVTVVVSKRFASGAAAVLTATSSTGATKTMTGEQARTRFSLPSTYVRTVAKA